MQRIGRKLINGLALAGLALALSACTSEVSLSDFNVVSKVSSMAGSNPLAFRGSAPDTLSVRPVTPNDLVGPQGECAGAPSTVAVDADGQPVGAPTAQGGIALQMTECEVVQRAGAPNGIEFGNTLGDRSVTLTYTRGPRVGIYHFSGGRLSSIERGSEPAPAPKPQKKSAPAKKRAPA
jgi:hypothetical protein